MCKALRLPLDSVRAVETVCRDVPDDILMRLERALSDNEKLRRLIAGLCIADARRRLRSRIPIVRAHARNDLKRIGDACRRRASRRAQRCFRVHDNDRILSHFVPTSARFPAHVCHEMLGSTKRFVIIRQQFRNISILRNLHDE